MHCFGLSFIQIQAEQLFHSWKMAISPRQSGWSLRWLLLLLGIGFEFWFFTANKKIHPGSMILIWWKTPKERPKKRILILILNEWINLCLHTGLIMNQPEKTIVVSLLLAVWTLKTLWIFFVWFEGVTFQSS